MNGFQPVKKVTQSGFAPVKKLNQQSGIWEAIEREAPKVLGGIAGGLIGIPGGPPGIVGGVALGASAGEAYRQIGQRVAGDPEAPQTSMEAAKAIGLAGAEEAAYELGGQAVARFAGKILAPFAKKVSAEAMQAIDTLKSKIRPALTPAEATESRALDILENISEASLLGGGKLSAFKIKRAKVMEDVADDLIDQFGKRVEPDEIGEIFTRTIEGKKDVHKAAANILYNNVEELAKGATVQTAGLKRFAQPLVDLSKDIAGIESKNAGDDLMSAVLTLPDAVDFATAKELRSRLISRVDEFSVINKKAPAIGKARKAIEILDNSIGEGLKKHNPEAYDVWREANKFYKEGQKDFNNTFIRRLIKKGDPSLGGDPEAIAKAIFKPGAITNIKRAKAAVDSQTWTQLQSYYVQRLMAQSTDIDGVIKGSRLLSNMFGKAGMGKKTLNEILSPMQLRGIENFATTLKITQSKQAEGLGKMWIQLTQAGAAATLFGMGSTPAAGVIMLGPPVMSRMLLNPTIAKLLSTGYRLPANSPLISGIAARISAAGIKINKERQQYLGGEQ